MESVSFPQVNRTFGPPPGLDESQVFSMPGYVGEIKQGNMEGTPVVIVCWQPDEAELRKIVETGRIFLSVCGGGLPPHFLAAEFPENYA